MSITMRDFVRLVREKRVERPQMAPIRVMTLHQSKGLEFDAVFIPEIASMKIIDGDLDQFKMNMYVMSSRARGNLFYIVDDYRSPVMSHFPSKEEKSQNTGLNLLEYEDA